MNIWYMNHYAGSRNEYNYGRPYFLSQALNNQGVHCRVICASFHHLMRNPANQKEKILSLDDSDISYTWVKTSSYKNNGLGRFKNMLQYALCLLRTDLVNEYQLEMPNVIVVSSAHPFHLFAGLKWSKKYRAKLIFEVRDIWPLSLNQLLGLSKFHPLSVALSWVERKAYRSADQVVSLMSNSKKYMQSKGLDPDKFNYIPNGISQLSPAESKKSGHSHYLNTLKKKGKFILMYTGAHGVPNALEPLIDAAFVLQQSGCKKVHFIFVGNGVCKKYLVTKARNLNIKNIDFLDPIPWSQIPDTLKFANLTLISWLDLPIYKYGISPNKIFEYMLASKPILMISSSPKNPLELSGGGKCIKSQNPIDIAKEIEIYSQLSPKELSKIGSCGYKYVKKNHLYEILASKYIALFKK